MAHTKLITPYKCVSISGMWNWMHRKLVTKLWRWSHPLFSFHWKGWISMLCQISYRFVIFERGKNHSIPTATLIPSILIIHKWKIDTKMTFFDSCVLCVSFVSYYILNAHIPSASGSYLSRCYSYVKVTIWFQFTYWLLSVCFSSII